MDDKLLTLHEGEFSPFYTQCCRQYFHLVKRRGSKGVSIDFIARDGWEKENTAVLLFL